MPLPKPSKNEKEKAYISRCISYATKDGGAKDNKQATAMCYSSWRKAKGQKEPSKKGVEETRDLTLSKKASIVRSAWETQYGNQSPYPWAQYVFDDYVVVRLTGRYIKIGYTWEDDGIEFDLEGAVEVEHEFSPVKARVGSSPIRAVEGKDNLYKCYGVRFTGPDELDAIGTYFDARTNFHLDWYTSRPWLHHHGRNKFIGATKVGDWTDCGIDDTGLFFIGELDLRNRYIKELQLLLDEDLMYPSTGALSYLISLPASDGHIAVWPVAELSSTVAPADFGAEAISEAAMRAIVTLEGEGGNDVSTFQELLDKLSKKGKLPEPGEAVTVPSEGTATPVPGELLVAEIPTIDYKALAGAVAENVGFDQAVRAIELLDGHIAILRALVEQHQVVLEGLAKAEVERLQDMAKQGEWFKSLYVASQQAAPVPSTQQDAETAARVAQAPYEAAGGLLGPVIGHT